jgi:Flp pilus assembly pilin Flp
MRRDFLGNECGQDVVEYSLLLVLLGVVLILVLTAMGGSISSIFSKISDRLSNASSQVS